MQIEEVGQNITDRSVFLTGAGVSQAILYDEKEHVLFSHTDWLTIACAFINTPESTSTCVTKNVQLCSSQNGEGHNSGHRHSRNVNFCIQTLFACHTLMKDGQHWHTSIL